jgi:hypothetical protein
MLSEKMYYILLACVIFTVVYIFQNNNENFNTAPSSLLPCEINLNKLKTENTTLKAEYDRKVIELNTSQSFIEGSIKNLASTQDRALIEAQRQFESSKNAISNTDDALKDIMSAFEVQSNVYEEIKKNGETSSTELEKAFTEVKDSNNAFNEEYKKYMGSINLGRLFNKAESFTDLPKQPTLEYFQQQSNEWRNDWKNKLNGIAIPNALEPKDKLNSVSIPFVINNELENNLNKTTAQYIATKVNRASNNVMIPGAKRIIRTMDH